VKSLAVDAGYSALARAPRSNESIRRRAGASKRPARPL